MTTTTVPKPAPARVPLAKLTGEQQRIVDRVLASTGQVNTPGVAAFNSSL